MTFNNKKIVYCSKKKPLKRVLPRLKNSYKKKLTSSKFSNLSMKLSSKLHKKQKQRSKSALRKLIKRSKIMRLS